MSWFSAPNPIESATSENIPNGEQNIVLNLDICDLVRSKKLAPADALKQLKRRIMHINPNVQILALHLLDLLIKNGGSHLLEAVATSDFMSSFAGQIRSQHIQGRAPEVVDLMLEYLQQWAYMTKEKPELSEIWNTYSKLKPQYKFPPVQMVGASFVESQVAPEWVDSEVCMKSGNQFTFYNRKHHCRNCGGVYLQEYCKDFLPLPQYGITEPVRVCVDCKEKLAGKEVVVRKGKGISSNNVEFESSYDRELRRALEASMTISEPPKTDAGAAPQEEMDDDMKAAIAASLADMQNVASTHHHSGPAADSAASATATNYANSPIQSPLSTPLPRNIDQGLVTPHDFERVQGLKQLLQQATPQDAIYDQRIIDGERHALSVQPKVVKDLTDAADKLQTLEDLHSRIVSISAYYDRFLDAELQRAQGNYSKQAPTRSPSLAQAPPHPMANQRKGPSYAPSYAPSYSQPLSRDVTGTAPTAPSAPSAPEPSAPVASAPMSKSALQLPDAPSAAPVHEPEEQEEEQEPEQEPMLIEL